MDVDIQVEAASLRYLPYVPRQLPGNNGRSQISKHQAHVGDRKRAELRYVRLRTDHGFKRNEDLDIAAGSLTPSSPVSMAPSETLPDPGSDGQILYRCGTTFLIFSGEPNVQHICPTVTYKFHSSALL